MNGDKQNAYDPKKDVGDTIRLLNGILDRGNAFARHIDTQANILIGVSSAIFILAQSKLNIAGNSEPLLILSLFAAIAALCALLAVHPPKFLRKRGQKESLMYNRKITEYASPDEYQKELSRIMGDQDAIIQQYTVEIYNLYKYYYQPKRALFRLARNILISGIGLSFITLIFNRFT